MMTNGYLLIIVIFAVRITLESTNIAEFKERCSSLASNTVNYESLGNGMKTKLVKKSHFFPMSMNKMTLEYSNYTSVIKLHYPKQENHCLVT